MEFRSCKDMTSSLTGQFHAYPQVTFQDNSVIINAGAYPRTRQVTVIAVRISTTTTAGMIVMISPGTVDLGTSPAINRKVCTLNRKWHTNGCVRKEYTFCKYHALCKLRNTWQDLMEQTEYTRVHAATTYGDSLLKSLTIHVHT